MVSVFPALLDAMSAAIKILLFVLIVYKALMLIQLEDAVYAHLIAHLVSLLDVMSAKVDTLSMIGSNAQKSAFIRAKLALLEVDASPVFMDGRLMELNAMLISAAMQNQIVTIVHLVIT